MTGVIKKKGFTLIELLSGSQPQGWGGLNEQGVHHVAMGWVGNVVTLYIDSCVESSGSALSATYKIIL